MLHTANAAVQEPQLWDCYLLAGSQIVLDRDRAVQESQAAKLQVATSFPFSQGDPSLCRGISGFNLLLI